MHTSTSGMGYDDKVTQTSWLQTHICNDPKLTHHKLWSRWQVLGGCPQTSRSAALDVFMLLTFISESLKHAKHLNNSQLDSLGSRVTCTYECTQKVIDQDSLQVWKCICWSIDYWHVCSANPAAINKRIHIIVCDLENEPKQLQSHTAKLQASLNVTSLRFSPAGQSCCSSWMESCTETQVGSSCVYFQESTWWQIPHQASCWRAPGVHSQAACCWGAPSAAPSGRFPSGCVSGSWTSRWPSGSARRTWHTVSGVPALYWTRFPPTCPSAEKQSKQRWKKPKCPFNLIIYLYSFHFSSTICNNFRLIRRPNFILMQRLVHVYCFCEQLCACTELWFSITVYLFIKNIPLCL